jgi:tetratricopeptide (TPR) repeat protein
MADAAAEARVVASLKPGAVALADAGHALIEARQYAVAKELLQPASSSPEVEVDLAVATFNADGGGAAAASEGLRVMDGIGEARRDAGYYVARAELLDAAEKPDEAVAAMQKALELSPASADLYWQAAALMERNHRVDEALRVLDQGAKALPRESEIAVTRALVLDISGKTDDATRVLSDAQRRWPEVASVWTARGVILAEHKDLAEAQRAFATATALGAHAVSPQTADPVKLFLSAPPSEW